MTNEKKSYLRCRARLCGGGSSLRALGIAAGYLADRLYNQSNDNQGRVTYTIEATKTPNQDRAKFMVEALRDVAGEVALIGISNQGLFMPLVAAARPIRRIVMINAVIPHPGQSFVEGSTKASGFGRILSLAS